MLKKLLGLFLLLGFSAGALAADENPYEKNYKAQNTGGLVSMQASPDTKMYASNHKDEDNISMLEEGYDLMGSSGFDAGNVLPELALQHAKSLKADRVLVYKKYGSAKTAASKMQLIKEAAKKNAGGEVEVKDLEADTTQYKYFASYWAKLPMPLLGVHIVKLKKVTEDEQPLEEKGITVLAVIKGSPAEKAGIKRGDVLLKMSDVELDKPEELSSVVRQFQGQNVPIEYTRGSVMNIARAQINSRN